MNRYGSKWIALCLVAALVAPALAQEEAAEIAAGGEQDMFFAGWESSFEAGLNGSDGNSETFNIYLAFESKKATETDRWDFSSAYFLNSSDGNTTKNEWLTNLKKEWLLEDSPWFVFALGGYELDEFEAFDHRFNAAAGIGYDIFDTEKFALKVNAGAGGKWEVYDKPETFTPAKSDVEFAPEALAGVELTWQITDNQTLNAATTFFPDLEDTDRYRIISSVDWKVKLSQVDGLNLKIGFANEYESVVDPGVERNDLVYYAAVVWDF